MGILKQLEADYELDIVADFLTHFELMATALEPLIIGLGNEKKCGANIDEIFRIFHNIKSAGGFLKIDPLVKLTMLAENIMEDARAQKSENCVASDEFIDWLLLVSDQMEQYRRDIEKDAIYLEILNPKIINLPKRLFV